MRGPDGHRRTTTVAVELPAGVRVPGQQDNDIVIAPRASVRKLMDAFERLLWWLFAGSAGAKTRAIVLRALKEQPRNAQQLSIALNLDYTTVRHHLKVMQQNRVVVSEGESYGRMYFVSENMEAHWGALEAILQKSSRRGAG
jgi:DNA-binding transcriptional ArsR family regulator